MQECSTDPTELFDIGQIDKTADKVKDVQTSKRNTQIYKDLTMHTCSQFPKKNKDKDKMKYIYLAIFGRIKIV